MTWCSGWGASLSCGSPGFDSIWNQVFSPFSASFLIPHPFFYLHFSSNSFTCARSLLHLRPLAAARAGVLPPPRAPSAGTRPRPKPPLSHRPFSQIFFPHSQIKAGAGSATLSMAYAAARFVESSLHALDGDSDVYDCAYIQSDLTELPFFASRIKIGRNGVEAVISSELQGLTEYEQKGLEALKPELKASIEKGVAFAQKQPVAA